MSCATVNPTTSDTTAYTQLSDVTSRDSSDSTTIDTSQHDESLPTPESIKKTSWYQKHTNGWRFGVLAGAVSAFVVLTINLGIFFAWYDDSHNHDSSDFTGGRILFQGSCDKTRKLNTVAHLLINVLSTLLLSASNYCMQCLSAPTRIEVDFAHAKGRWLDVGVLSMRNLFAISKKRVVLYLLLGLSSLPLHLFYNSTVYSTIAANRSYIYSANVAFTNANSSNYVDYKNNFTDIWPGNPSGADKLFNATHSSQFTRLEPAECLKAYSVNFQTSYRDIILISLDESFPQINKSAPAIQYEGTRSPGDLDLPGFDGEADITPWHPFSLDVSYCLAEQVQERCKLEFSTYLAVLVIVLNTVKVITVFYLAIGISEEPLMTVGDAVSSFLEIPDHSTQGMCLVTKEEIRSGAKRKGASWVPMSRQYLNHRRRKFVAASRSRWIISITLIILAILLVTALFALSMSFAPPGTPALFSLSFGAITPNFLIGWSLPSTGTSALITNVLVANIPQIILSFIYFTYNALFTCMSLATEWSSFASRRKGIRVSGEPRGNQRGTYFLQLPYRLSLPLLIVSATLHWLVSESIFLAAIDIDASSNTPSSYITCGYSPPPMLYVIIVGCLMILAALVSGFAKLPSGMPVVGSCSAAISAACHGEIGKDYGGSARAQEKVMWGVIGEESFVGHCGITDQEVTVPVERGWYAGSTMRKRQ